MKYFKGIETLEELKKEYKRLVKIYHPDNNGDGKILAEINVEFEKASRIVNTKNVEFNASKYMDIINKLMVFDITIEIIGSWIWLEGDTKPIKEHLKELGFRWACKKHRWYYHEGTYVKKSKKVYSMSDIKNMHGCKTIKRGHRDKDLIPE